MASQHQGTHVPAVRAALEKRLGITERSSPVDFAWIADIRKRFTDFLVHEIRKDGTVVHLLDFEVPEPTARKPIKDGNAKQARDEDAKTASVQADTKPPVQPIPEADRQILEGLIGPETTTKLLELDELIQAKDSGADKSSVQLPPIMDRPKRSEVHQEIRRIFSSRFETATDQSGTIKAVPSSTVRSSRGGGQGSGRRRDGSQLSRDGHKSFAQLGGDYLHCILYKENKDTMDAINLIARMLKVKVQNFGFSGTKDRRAATVQRISIYRQRAHNLVWLNSRMTGVKVGDFRHSKYPVQLGQHAGNEFAITLKNCEHYRGANCSLAIRARMIQQSVELGLLHLYKHGFINYFGLQRFGTHSIGTHELGKKILQGNFEGAVEDILHVDPQAMTDMLSDNSHGPAQINDEANRARAIASFRATGDADAALSYLPKRFGAETSIIRHLSRDNQRRDYVGALLTITKGMRQMYIHAYQSYVWNHVATLRWAKYGPQVIEGDLVLLDNNTSRDDGDGVRDPSADWENFYAQVRPLTAQDVASGKHTIFDVVLPTPGFDVIYPGNDIGEYYKSFMARPENGGLDPYSMRRRQKEFSLSGSYRPLMGRFLQRPEYIIRLYSDDNEQMYPTDVDLIMQRKAEAGNGRKRRLDTDEEVASLGEQSTQNATQHEKMRIGGPDPGCADQPTPPESGRIEQGWAKTGVDVGGKRIKIEHRQPSTAQGSPGQGAKVQSEQADPEAAGPVQQSNLSSSSGPASSKDGSEAPLPYLQDASAPASTALGAPKTVDSAEAGDEDPMDLSGVAADVKTSSHSAPNALDTVSRSQLGGVSGLSTPTTACIRGGQPSLGSSGSPSIGRGGSSAGPTRNTVRAHEFQQVSDNPTLAFAPGINTSKEGYGDGTKIAVVLKFQLRSSSYATIVLRELMGTIQEDGSGNSNGDSHSSTP